MSATAQENCALESSPPVFGLKLDMTPEQAQNVSGKDLKIKIKKKGQRTFFQNFIKNPAPRSLSGVRAIYLRFFDGRLYQIEVFYENRADWRTLEDFTDNFPAQATLPVWKFGDKKAEIRCGEFSVVADNILNPRIEITNETVRARVEEIREKESEKK